MPPDWKVLLSPTMAHFRATMYWSLCKWVPSMFMETVESVDVFHENGGKRVHEEAGERIRLLEKFTRCDETRAGWRDQTRYLERGLICKTARPWDLYPLLAFAYTVLEGKPNYKYYMNPHNRTLLVLTFAFALALSEPAINMRQHFILVTALVVTQGGVKDHLTLESQENSG